MFLCEPGHRCSQRSFVGGDAGARDSGLWVSVVGPGVTAGVLSDGRRRVTPLRGSFASLWPFG